MRQRRRVDLGLGSHEGGSAFDPLTDGAGAGSHVRSDDGAADIVGDGSGTGIGCRVGGNVARNLLSISDTIIVIGGDVVSGYGTRGVVLLGVLTGGLVVVVVVVISGVVVVTSSGALDISVLLAVVLLARVLGQRERRQSEEENLLEIH